MAISRVKLSKVGGSVKSIAAFFLGMAEFRSDLTTNPGDHLIEAYDAGREWAHRLTFRLWEIA